MAHATSLRAKGTQVQRTAQTGVARARDAEDITALRAQLAIHTREQAQALVDRYADRPWQEECMLQATLDALF